MSTHVLSSIAALLVLAATTVTLGCSDDSASSDPSPSPAASTPSPSPTPASTQEARVKVVAARIAATNAKDWNAWEALHTPDATRTAPELEAPLHGANVMRAAIEALVVTFPDYHLELVDAFGSGDKLVARIHTRGTMNGPMEVGGMKIPPTNRSFEQDWVAVLRFEGDRIASVDEFYDNYGTMMQLGLGGGAP